MNDTVDGIHDRVAAVTPIRSLESTRWAGATSACRECGCEPARAAARFCDSCGAAIDPTQQSAEYKHVTVLFADVVGSMQIASALDAERLREVMAEVFRRSAAVVRRLGGTVDHFTGDGIMALFGAPVALEDHALRACTAALGIQREAEVLAAEVERRDNVLLQLRVGLNSGLVITGDLGSPSRHYTAIGAPVGMAQRMESVAPPGGVMISASTARLVANSTLLGEPEIVRPKGADVPTLARRLVGVTAAHTLGGHADRTLIGRDRELGVLANAIASPTGGVVGIIGAGGIGKSRLVRATAALAETLGLEVFSAPCESIARMVPFDAARRLLRLVSGLDGVDGDEVRDADGRRLAQLLKTALERPQRKALYVIEDVHWIDEDSESLLAECFSSIPLLLVTYRPDYRGALSRIPGSHVVALAALDAPQMSALTAELLGPDPSVQPLVTRIVDVAVGIPYFAEEIVGDLAECGLLTGEPCGYTRHGDVARVSAPATVQTAIAARLDRLDAAAKRTLFAAAVIGPRFDEETLVSLLDSASVRHALDTLIDAELIEGAGSGVFVFRHPLIRAVAYDVQLKSARADLIGRIVEGIGKREIGGMGNNEPVQTRADSIGDFCKALFSRRGQAMNPRSRLN